VLVQSQIALPIFLAQDSQPSTQPHTIAPVQSRHFEHALQGLQKAFMVVLGHLVTHFAHFPHFFLQLEPSSLELLLLDSLSLDFFWLSTCLSLKLYFLCVTICGKGSLCFLLFASDISNGCPSWLGRSGKGLGTLICWFSNIMVSLFSMETVSEF